MTHPHANQHTHHDTAPPAAPFDATHWDAIYRSGPRWDIGRPQPAFQALADSGAITGRVLDVGCGTGEHVLMCAGLGLDTTGVDLSAVALQAAADKARTRGLTARFLQLDVRHLDQLHETFDTVLDSGLFVHVYDDQNDRAAYLDRLHAIVNPGGRCFILCFRAQARGRAHDGLTIPALITTFPDGWRVDSIEPTSLDGVDDPASIPAWLVTLTRT